MMKSHPDRLQLMEYAEGTLKGMAAAPLAEHLGSCADCRRKLEGWLGLEAALRSFPMVAEPADFTASVMRRLPQPRRSPVAVGLAWLRANPGRAAAALLLGLLALLDPLGGGLSPANLWDWGYQVLFWTRAAGEIWGLWLEPSLGPAVASLLKASPIITAALLLAALALGPLEPDRRATR